MKAWIVLAFVAPGLALAGQPIEERAEMAPDGKVTVISRPPISRCASPSVRTWTSPA